MDKELLIQELKHFYENLEPDNGLVNDNDDKFETLCNEIQNGEFDKQPCEHCNSGYYRDLKGGSYSVDLYQYCPNCGRKFEVPK